MLAVLAGAFLALGGVFVATPALAGAASSPWGPVRVLAGVVLDTPAEIVERVVTNETLPIDDAAARAAELLEQRREEDVDTGVMYLNTADK